jgi:hypothetical protein
MFDCWVDGDVDKKVRMDGWWKLEKLNIAQSVFSPLSLCCEFGLLRELTFPLHILAFQDDGDP